MSPGAETYETNHTPKIQIFWAVNSASTLEAEFAPVKDITDRPSIFPYQRMVRYLETIGLIASAGSSIADEPTETQSKTYEAKRAREWAIEMRRIVESGDIVKARHLLLRMTPSQIQHYNLERWKELLEVPKASRSNSATGTPISGNISVLHTNKIEEYRGKWVALLNGEYLDSNKSKVALYRNLKDQNKLTDTTFIYIDI